MHAVILELPSGKVLGEKDWYLHDRRRYLWPLGPGKFLLRKLNDLYEVDSSLREKLLLSSPTGSCLGHGHAGCEPDCDRNSGRKGRQSPELFFAFSFSARTEIRRTISECKNFSPSEYDRIERNHDPDCHQRGIRRLHSQGRDLVSSFRTGGEQRHNLARVRSQTAPNVLYASNNPLLIGRCPIAELRLQRQRVYCDRPSSLATTLAALSLLPGDRAHRRQ